MMQKIEIYGDFANPENLINDLAIVLQDNFDCELEMISRKPILNYEGAQLEDD